MANRHGGVIAFGVMGIASGIIGSLANGLLLMMVVLARSRHTDLDPNTQTALASVNVGMLIAIAANVVTSLMVFASGIGVLTYKGWARVGYLVAAAITIVNRLLTFPLHFQHPATPAAGDTMVQLGYQIGNVSGDVLTLIFSGLVLWFFNRSAITSLFTHPVASSS